MTEDDAKTKRCCNSASDQAFGKCTASACMAWRPILEIRQALKSCPSDADLVEAGWDSDGSYCGHPESFKISMLGLGFSRMRSIVKTETDGKCGVEGLLWEAKDD